MTSEAAFAELKQIAAEIEKETVPVDTLAEKVRRASELIEFCQSKLRATEAEVSRIISRLEARDEGGK